VKDVDVDESNLKRPRQMLHELAVGGVYMNLDHPPSRKK